MRFSLLRSSVRRAHAHAHSHSQPSTNGWLFSEKPARPGEHRVKENWETPFYSLFVFGMTVATVLHLYRPDTRVQTKYNAIAKQELDAE
eukprot:m.161417 g.161417  ORF g.161417 m.161417 type:complete len:89 (-) comp16376_c0_seq16:2401-2667(-)